MADFVPVPNICQVELRYTWDGQQIENVVYFWSAGGWSVEEAQSLHLLIVSQWTADVRPEVANTLSLNSIKYTDISSSTGFAVELNIGLPVAGAAGTGSLPNNCALCIQFITAMRGRSFRGRNYLPGLVEGAVTNNLVAGSFSGAWQDFYTNLNAAAVTAGFSQHVVSRISGGVQRSIGIASEVIAWGYADNFVDSQRRRLPGRGR